MSKYLKILHPESTYSYLRCIKGTACLANIAKHSFKTSPIKPHYETVDINQQFGPVHQEGG